MAVAAEMAFGGTTVRIYDDCCRDRTPEDVRAMLRRIASRAQAELSAAAQGREEQKQGEERDGQAMV